MNLFPKNQEEIFKLIFKKAENQFCADCNYPAPSWASITFGTFICYNCSGFHRQLGPTISKVRSINLDKWTQENLEIMSNVGNKHANQFWEGTLNSSDKINAQNDELEKKNFIIEKYVKKLYITNINVLDPVQLFLKNKKEGKLKENIGLDLNKNNLEIIQKRNITPEPVKSYGFDWDKAKAFTNIKKNQEKWENFDKCQVFKRNHSNNALLETHKSKIKKELEPEVINFKAVSKELREQLLKGNPLDKLLSVNK